VTNFVAAGGKGVRFNYGEWNSVRQSSIVSSGHGVLFNLGSFVAVSFSTVVAANNAVYLLDYSSGVVQNSYVQSASTGVMADGSTGTLVGHIVAAITGTNGSAVAARGGVNLSVTSSTLQGGLLGAGLFVDAGNKGLIRLSTNVVSGSRYGIRVSSQAPDAEVWITSNVVVSTLSTTTDSYGLYLEGLRTGATVYNNSFVTRARGGAAARTHFGAFIKSSGNIQFHRNRISNPGRVAVGSYEAVRLTNGHRVSFMYNDVHSSGAFTTHHMLRLISGSTANVVANNIFASSATAVSSATVSVDAGSQAGFSSDFNDYFSSNSALGFFWGTTAAQGLEAWKAASGEDGNSISAHPQWYSITGEDFHPLSTVGRYDPATQSFTGDALDSPVIDAGDVNEDFNAEPAPNGFRVNQGSYGGTAEASKSNESFAGCAVVRFVHKNNGPYTTIGSALASLPGTLTGHSCVVIQDGATYDEQVTVRNFTNNGSSISIFANPVSGVRPVIDPPAGSTAAFQVANSSVNLLYMDVRPTVEPVAYGVLTSSAYVSVTSITVDGGVWAAGIAVSSRNAVAYSSVSVGDAHGIWLMGSTMTTVGDSRSSNTAAGRYALYLQGASSNTVSGGMFLGLTRLEAGSIWNVLETSTFTAAPAAGAGVVAFVQSSSNTLRDAYG
jgi:hypothetical protein